MPTTIRAALCMALHLLASCGGHSPNRPVTLGPWQHLQSVGALDRPSLAPTAQSPWQMNASCLLGGTVVLDQNTRTALGLAQGGGASASQALTITSDATFDFKACRGATATFSGQLKRSLFAPLVAKASAFSDRLTGTLDVSTQDFHDPHCHIDLTGTQDADGTFHYQGTLCGKSIDK